MKCPTCNKEFDSIKKLSRHVGHSANHIDIKDFYDKYLKKENEGICLNCGSVTKFECVSRGYTKYCSKICCDSSDIRKKLISDKHKTEETRRKSENTSILRYGVKNPFQSIEIQKKYKNTFFERYGTENPSQVEEIKNRKIQTCLDHFGVENPFQSDSIKEKIKETNTKKYGYPYSSQNSSTRQKYRDTCMLKFGVDNISKTFEMREIYREKFLRDLSIQKNNGLPIKGRIGKYELDCLNELQKHSKFIFKRLQICGYLPDSYISELNLIIEFNEDFHKYSWCVKKDKQKYSDLYQKLKCDFFIIDKREWLINKEKIILEFVDLLNRKESVQLEQTKNKEELT